MNMKHFEGVLAECIENGGYIGGEIRSRPRAPGGGWFDLDLMKVNHEKKR